MGAGRIGKMHAKFIATHPKAKLKYIYDVNKKLIIIIYIERTLYFFSVIIVYPKIVT